MTERAVLAERRDGARKSSLAERLRQNGRRLSRKHAVLANFFLEEYRRAAFMTAAEIGARLVISPSTVVRFATAMGYAGYPALRRQLHQMVQADLRGTELFARHVERREPNLLHSIIERETQNLSRLLKDHPMEELDRLAGAIVRAGRVFVVGFRASSSLARYFGYHLEKIHPLVFTLTEGGSRAFDLLSTAGPSDVLIAVGFPRYPREELELIDFARREGVVVGAVTDSVLSPLAKRASVVIPVRGEVVSFVDSFCAPQVVLTALLVRASMKNQLRTRARLKRFEELASRQGFFHPGG